LRVEVQVLRSRDALFQDDNSKPSTIMEQMNQSTPLAAIAFLIVALLATVTIEEHRLRSEQSRAGIVSLKAANMAAESDSTRNVAMENHRIATLLGDSLGLVERQVTQVAQRSDALDDALGRERRARYSMSVAADSLRATALAPAVVDTAHDVRRASFELRQVPYTVEADVEIPEKPDTARLSLRVALDPIHVDARLTCSAPNDQGIRTASVVAAAPVWATVRFDRVEQSPELCASPALMRADRSRRAFGLLKLLFGAGRVMDVRGLASWGVFVGIGTSLGG
jgi:hypothetical protein